MMAPPWLKAFRLNSVKTQSESCLCVCPSLFESHLRKDSLSTPGLNICHTHARWSVYSDRMPFFRKVVGLHNWLFYAYLESKNLVNYIEHKTNVVPTLHGQGNRVSYILREGDLGKRRITVFIIINQRLSCFRNTVLNLYRYRYRYRCRMDGTEWLFSFFVLFLAPTKNLHDVYVR